MRAAGLSLHLGAGRPLAHRAQRRTRQGAGRAHRRRRLHRRCRRVAAHPVPAGRSAVRRQEDPLPPARQPRCRGRRRRGRSVLWRHRAMQALGRRRPLRCRTRAGCRPLRWRSRAKARGQTHLVIRPGAKSRSALVLAPSAWEHQYNRADGVAEILNAMPDYNGNVTLLQNLAPDQHVVSVDDFRGWDAYDVIYVTTHGGEICWDTTTGVPYHACKGAILSTAFNQPGGRCHRRLQRGCRTRALRGLCRRSS